MKRDSKGDVSLRLSLRRRANAPNVSFRMLLLLLIHIITSVGKIKSFCNTYTDAAPLVFLRKRIHSKLHEKNRVITNWNNGPAINNAARSYKLIVSMPENPF